jgi:RNA polymerase sigma-70 factor, ECF subfamily
MAAAARERPDAETETALVIRAVERAQCGDREAFGFLYARFADDVKGYVRSILGDAHEAEDVTQQVFVKLFSAIGKYQQREVPFFAWILRVARNMALDHIRARRTVPVEEVRIPGALGDTQSRRLEELREALSGLPSDQREVLLLRHLAGLSPSEIATRTGRTEASIHGLHHRGRRTLQSELLSRGLGPATAASPTRATRVEAG